MSWTTNKRGIMLSKCSNPDQCRSKLSTKPGFFLRKRTSTWIKVVKILITSKMWSSGPKAWSLNDTRWYTTWWYIRWRFLEYYFTVKKCLVCFVSRNLGCLVCSVIIKKWTLKLSKLQCFFAAVFAAKIHFTVSPFFIKVQDFNFLMVNV